MSRYAERVNRGAALLDQVIPGWHTRISLDDLALESGCMCVFGQLFEGRYFEGEHKFFGMFNNPAEEAASFGFRLSSEDIRDLEDDDSGWDAEDQMWDDLTKEWQDAIHERLVRDQELDPRV